MLSLLSELHRKTRLRVLIFFVVIVDVSCESSRAAVTWRALNFGRAQRIKKKIV